MTEVLTDLQYRDFKLADAMQLVSHLNAREIQRDTTISFPLNLKDAQWWISYVNDCAKRSNPTEHHFAIQVDGKLVGSVALINKVEHRAELGYWLAKDYWGQGMMTDAIGHMLEYGVEHMGIHRIFAPVLPHNKASSRVLEKNGFEAGGVLKDYFYKDGSYINALSYVYLSK